MSYRREFIGSFDRYVTIDDLTYYLILDEGHYEWQYLINCREYTEYVGELKPNDKLDIKADATEKLSEGILLENVVWRPLEVVLP
jgi:hypothetical protein